MENLNLLEIWKQNESLLDQSIKLNTKLLKEVKLDQAKSSLQRLLFLPVSTLVFFILAASYSLHFAVTHHATWYFAFSGAVVTFFSLLFILSSARQLRQILSIDYHAPVVKLQKRMAQIKVSVVHNLRIAAWMLPFSPFIGLFFFKVLFEVDLAAAVNFNTLVVVGVLTIVLEMISLVIQRALRPKNINKKWLNWFLQGSGSQVDQALGFLNQLRDFEDEAEK